MGKQGESMVELIKLTGLSKAYDNKLIFDDISLTIHEGESVALVGHNGTGKSTLLKILCGLTDFQAGTMQQQRKLKFNYVPEYFPKLAITARQYIYHVGIIEGLTEAEITKRSNYYYKLFNMEKMVNKPIKVLSKGTLQKVSVIQAMLIKPDVLLLDEPLSGQDADAQLAFIEMVQALKAEQVTIIMSCHEEFLIKALSDTAYTIIDGKLVKTVIRRKTAFDLLVFQPTVPMESHVLERITTIFDRVVVTDTEIKIYTKPEISNQVIQYMFKLKFELRRMSSEEA